MEILFNIGIAVLGILLYLIFSAKNFVARPDWSWQKFLSDNIVPLMWSIIAATAIAITLAAVPGSGEAIKTITGIDLTMQEDGTIHRIAYLTLGFVLSVTIRTGAK